MACDNPAMRIFYNLLGNNVIATVTNFTVWFSITFFAFLETKSVFVTGMLSGIYLMLVALLGIWFGSLVDHHPKKNVMLFSSVISLVAYAAMLGLYLAVPEGTFSDPSNPLLWVFAVGILLGVVAGNLRTIAMPVSVSLFVPEDMRDRANGMVGTAFGFSFMIVSVVSGLLIGYAGMEYVLGLAVATTLLALMHLLLLQTPEESVVANADQPKRIDIRGTIAAILAVQGLVVLIFFTTFNNFLGGVFMALMDAYGLSLVSVQVWGIMWGILSSAIIVGGLVISKWGLGANPLRTMLFANIVIWTSSALFTIYPSIILLAVGMFFYMCVFPYIEATEQTVIQKVVPVERQGRVFGFAQSIEQMASPITAFLIGPIAQFIAIPFMTTGAGVELIGDWFGTGPARGLALVFTVTGLIGLTVTMLAFRSRAYRQLSAQFVEVPGVSTTS